MDARDGRASGRRQVTVDANDLVRRAARVLPGGATHAARAYTPPVYVQRAEASRKWLVDGRELVDYTMGHGALLFGHAHPTIRAAVRDQVARGTHFGAAHPLEVEWAERICALMSSVEEVRFTASGTEAAMLGLRVARAATGRQVVVKLDGHFHGWSDSVSVDLENGAVQVAPGVTHATAQTTRVVPADLAALQEAVAPGDVAGVILEASGAHYGRVPLSEGFLNAARRLCDQTGALLIVDEVVTGFRVAAGGMQQVLGVDADLSVLGKVMAGGLPGGALAGRRDLMELLASRIAHPGTFNANPLTAAAGIAALNLCADGRPQRVAAERATALAAGWTEVLQQRGVPGLVRRLASILHLQLEDADQQATLAARLRAEGVDLLHTSAFCSTVHTDDDVEQTVAALDRALDSKS